MSQVALERKYSKKNLYRVLEKSVEIEQLVELTFNIEDYRNKSYFASKNERISRLPDSMELAKLIAIEVLRCNGTVKGIQGLAASIAYKLPMPHLDAVKCAMEIIAVNDDCALYELLAHDYEGNPTGTLAVEPKIVPDEETLAVIQQFKYMPPNLTKPIWRSNDDGGMTSFKDHCILGQGNQHNKYQALDALNLLQAVKWEIDPVMLQYAEKPSKKVLSKEYTKHYPTEVKQFKQMAKESKALYEEYRDNPFYFVWKYDKRGRMYSCGYHINLQSSDYKKAILSFATKEVLTG